MTVLLRDHGWSSKQDGFLQMIKAFPTELVPMPHLKDACDVFLYTNTSQNHWGALSTKVASGKLSKLREEQDHFPLVFKSGSFKGSMLISAKIEKEAFTIMEICMLMECFLLRKNSSMYHRPSNSVTHIRPKSGDDAIFRHRAGKGQQRSMVLEMCRYTVEHVAASEIALSDLLSQWI